MTIYTMEIPKTKDLISLLKHNNIDMVMDIRSNKPFVPKSLSPSKDSHKYINKTITEAGIGYRWVMCLSNNFGNIRVKYEDWINHHWTQPLLRSIAGSITKDGVKHLCIMCDEEDTKTHAATAFGKILGWEIQHL